MASVEYQLQRDPFFVDVSYSGRDQASQLHRNSEALYASDFSELFLVYPFGRDTVQYIVLAARGRRVGRTKLLRSRISYF